MRIMSTLHLIPIYTQAQNPTNGHDEQIFGFVAETYLVREDII